MNEEVAAKRHRRRDFQKMEKGNLESGKFSSQRTGLKNIVFKEPNTKGESFEKVLQSVKNAAVLVLVC